MQDPARASRREADAPGDQDAVLKFLSDPATHGSADPVRRIDTHGAVVFLAGGDAFKVKRAVRFPFLDYSTLERRRAACEAEVEINRPNAPNLYLGTVPITRSGEGLALGGPGEAIEWAVHMRRFDEAATLDRLAASGGLSALLLTKLARAVLASHARAPRRDGAAATAALRRYIAQNDAAFRQEPDLFSAERARTLTAAAASLLEAVTPLLLARGEAGCVRRCHGDLHLRNIVLLDGEPTLFDAVEFDDGVATGDVLYDLAFLLMDLWERALTAAANVVLNRYLWESEEAHLPGLAALPLFLSLRAAIRAKVTALALPHLGADAKLRSREEAAGYFDAALRFLDPTAPRIVAIGGLSGTGKSTLAAALAPEIGRAPGAVHLRSDIERKRLFGVPEERRLGPEAYGLAATERVYAVLRRKAELAARAGRAVIVDAVHARPEEREAIENVARAMSLPFTGLWLEAPLSTLVRRVESRSGDASDADAEVVTRQAGYRLGPLTWHRLDAAEEHAALRRAALAKLTPAQAGAP